MAMAGLDRAFLDALGHAAGMSVARMLGGSDRALPCYDSQGVFKQGRDEPLNEETLLAIRAIIGPDVKLMADYNQALIPTDATARIHTIEDVIALDWGSVGMNPRLRNC